MALARPACSLPGQYFCTTGGTEIEGPKMEGYRGWGCVRRASDRVRNVVREILG